MLVVAYCVGAIAPLFGSDTRFGLPCASLRAQTRASMFKPVLVDHRHGWESGFGHRLLQLARSSTIGGLCLLQDRLLNIACVEEWL
eukprot:12127594-Alexandrium_andersonii.AAC.1